MCTCDSMVHVWHYMCILSYTWWAWGQNIYEWQYYPRTPFSLPDMFLFHALPSPFSSVCIIHHPWTVVLYLRLCVLLFPMLCWTVFRNAILWCGASSTDYYIIPHCNGHLNCSHMKGPGSENKPFSSISRSSTNWATVVNIPCVYCGLVLWLVSECFHSCHMIYYCWKTINFIHKFLPSSSTTTSVNSTILVIT
jgi:hypothetical protein